MRIYFAHPCFTEEQKRFKETFLEILFPLISDKNITIIDPFEYTPPIENDSEVKLKMAEKIKEECLRLLKSCDIVMALSDWDDTGTAFEIGYAYAIGKPVILISRTRCETANAMLIGAAQLMVSHVLSKNGMERLVSYLECCGE